HRESRVSPLRDSQCPPVRMRLHRKVFAIAGFVPSSSRVDDYGPGHTGVDAADVLVRPRFREPQGERAPGVGGSTEGPAEERLPRKIAAGGSGRWAEEGGGRIEVLAEEQDVGHPAVVDPGDGLADFDVDRGREKLVQADIGPGHAGLHGVWPDRRGLQVGQGRNVATSLSAGGSVDSALELGSGAGWLDDDRPDLIGVDQAVVVVDAGTKGGSSPKLEVRAARD